jgi:hypothetical protein
MTTQQFTAALANSGAVVWSVDGIPGGEPDNAGTIDGTGLYTPPRSSGSHEIKAVNTADSTTATAQVYVNDFPGVFTYHYDNSRSGQNVQEIALAPQNVNASSFGKLATYSVDGIVYGQPLYLADLNVRGAYHNVVYVATENNSVYAFDADAKQSTALWQVSFINPAAGITTVPCGQFVSGCIIASKLGITSTPVIDPTTGTLYVLARTLESGAYLQKLHALDLGSGSEKFGGPITIEGSVAGSGAASQSGIVPFQGIGVNNRAALLLVNGTIYIGFASLSSAGSPHGWIFGYAVDPSSDTLRQVAIWNTTPNGSSGGIWGVGSLAADSSGNLFSVVGDGTNDLTTSFGNSVLRFTSGSLALGDYFVPYNVASLNVNDKDLGSGSLLLLPDGLSDTYPHLMISAGKEGRIYLLNRDNLGQFDSSGDQVVQELTAQAANGFFGSPAYWNNFVYFGGNQVPLKAYQLSNGWLSSAPVSQTALAFLYPGVNPSVSANGSGHGIVWVAERKGILRAYDATYLATELYDSTQESSRDAILEVAKFSTPTVANGRVYVVGIDAANSQGKLYIFGLLP